MPGTPAIREFPHDDAVWHIDWLGEVEQTGYEPKIDVHLSRQGNDGEAALVQAADAARVIQIGVGQLPYLCTGSRWRNGQRLTSSSQKLRKLRLKEIRFEDATIRRFQIYHSIGERIGRDGKPRNLSLVPSYAHPIPTCLGKTRCFAIEYQGDPYGIVVPAHEVARFYYGQSSALALAMFRGALAVAPLEVWDRDKCSITEIDGRRRAVIVRSKWMGDNDCWVLGRIWGDENARRGAQGIYESLLLASANRQRRFVNTDIPFRGTASWSVRAVQITESGGPPRWLVLEILSCSGAFPYDDLAVIADKDTSSPAAGDAAADDKSDGFPGVHVATREEANDELRSDAPPSAGVRPIILLNPGGCFEAIQGKCILDLPSKSGSRSRGGESWLTTGGLADMATGLGTYGESGIKPAKVVMAMDGKATAGDGDAEDATSEADRREALRATFENLVKITDALAAMKGVAVQIRESKLVGRIPLTAEPYKAQWAWLDSAAQRHRAVMVVDVVLGDRTASVIEFQQRVSDHCTLGVLVAEVPMLLADAAIVGILRKLALKHGVWKQVSEPGVRIVGLPHTRTTAEAFADAIVEAIKAADVDADADLSHAPGLS